MSEHLVVSRTLQTSKSVNLALLIERMNPKLIIMAIIHFIIPDIKLIIFINLIYIFNIDMIQTSIKQQHINNKNKKYTKQNKSNSSVAKPYKHIKHFV